MKVYIYALKSPVDGKVMYVGKARNPQTRYEQHVFEGWRYAPSNAKLRWLRDLYENDLKPELEIIDECDETNHKEIEMKWIAHFAKINPLLTNVRHNPVLYPELYGESANRPANNNPTTNKKFVSFILRLPSDLYEWVQEEAKREHRSINAQIATFIEQGLKCRELALQPTHRAPTT